MDVGDGEGSTGAEAGSGQVRVHEPVLLAESLQHLELASGLELVDGTVGAGGHAASFARAIGPDGLLIGLDRDAEILEHAERRLREVQSEVPIRYQLHHASYASVRDVLRRAECEGCDRCFLDLGVSSLQLDRAERGFSFQHDGPLDMRMNREGGVTAEQWLRRVPERELARVLFEYGEERHSRRIAKAIVTARQGRAIERTGQLAEIIVSALPSGARHGRIHGATRSFQAIRIALNDELGELERGLEACIDVLRPGGRIAVLSFHSLEDRIVKRTFREQLELPRGLRRPIQAGAEEQTRNPRARSAKLRVGIKRGAA